MCNLQGTTEVVSEIKPDSSRCDNSKRFCYGEFKNHEKNTCPSVPTGKEEFSLELEKENIEQITPVRETRAAHQFRNV